MTRRERTLLLDVVLSALIAVIVVVVSPGLAVVALVALATLIVVGLSLFVGGLRSRLAARRRPGPPSGSPRGRPAPPPRRPRATRR